MGKTNIVKPSAIKINASESTAGDSGDHVYLWIEISLAWTLILISWLPVCDYYSWTDQH